MLEQVLTALKSIRAPVATDEYDLHQLACQALAQAGIGCVPGLGGAGFFVFEDWF